MQKATRRKGAKAKSSSPIGRRLGVIRRDLRANEKRLRSLDERIAQCLRNLLPPAA